MGREEGAVKKGWYPQEDGMEANPTLRYQIIDQIAMTPTRGIEINSSRFVEIRRPMQ
jgi:hypothetical protein